MKFFPTLYTYFLRSRSRQRNLVLLFRFFVVFLVIVFTYGTIFHYLMDWEGKNYSWITGLYWTMTVMSTLGLGDITFESDAGKIFSIIVLITGTLFMLVLFPFLFIQFFYAPWMEAQEAARIPRELPADTQGHIVLTHHDAVTGALIDKLNDYHYRYVLVIPTIEETLRLHDEGLNVVFGELDDPDTYRKIRADQAAMVATTATDEVNTHVAFTVRELQPEAPIVATAIDSASVDILNLAGCSHVFQLDEMMGQALARRTLAGDAMSHVIGSFDDLLIAEATCHGTPLVGKTLKDSKLREMVSVSVVGVWERGRFIPPDPDTAVTENTFLVLAGSEEQLRDYDALFCIYNVSSRPVVIIGGGKVGRATSRALKDRDIDYRIVERLAGRVRDPNKYVVGNAAELEVLEEAGIKETATVIITTHNDDMNVYLTIYCRRLRPDVQIISRATLERNIPILHRAGADMVMSYASMGASALFNILKRTDIVFVAEGLDFFRMKIPPKLSGKSLAGSRVREETGCTVIAVKTDGQIVVTPDPVVLLPNEGEMILVGSEEAEESFLAKYGSPV
jgi:voltage-gated potassium channel